MGDLYYKMQDYKRAIQYSDSALQISKEIRDLEAERTIYENLAAIYKSTQNYKEAYRYYVLFKGLTDSIFNQGNSRELAELKIRFEVEKKESERKLKAEAEKEKMVALVKEEKKRDELVFIAFSVLFILVLLFAIMMYKRVVLAKKQNKIIESLLKEVHHRVKNNLQVIHSLLNLQKNYISDEKTKNIFQDCQNRVCAMSSIHEKLYTNNVFSGINFNEYIHGLIKQLINSYQLNYSIQYEVEIEENLVEMGMLIPIGLLTNEIISNSLKYAFSCENEHNLIRFQLKKRQSDYSLIIGDNGQGSAVSLQDEHVTFGMELIKILVEQLRGEIRRVNMPGTYYEVTFKA